MKLERYLAGKEKTVWVLLVQMLVAPVLCRCVPYLCSLCVDVNAASTGARGFQSYIGVALNDLPVYSTVQQPSRCQLRFATHTP
jgi:hypothetical protein